MDITIRINCDNAAFEHRLATEVLRILTKQVMPHLADGGDGCTLRDINGNTVGNVEVSA